MNKIELNSALLKVVAINKPTKAKFFKYLEVGDLFTVETSLRSIGRSSSGLYASKFTFRHVKIDGTVISDTMTANQAMNCLSNFQITEACRQY